jgi:hypothetical protein
MGLRWIQNECAAVDSTSLVLARFYVKRTLLVEQAMLADPLKAGV